MRNAKRLPLLDFDFDMLDKVDPDTPRLTMEDLKHVPVDPAIDFLEEDEKPMKKHTHKPARTVEFCACGATRTDGGEWVLTGKDPNAVAMGHKAAAMATAEERADRASAGGDARWKGTSPRSRSEVMREIASRPRPGARIEDRCECGRFSREYAERHRHLCGKALTTAMEALEARSDR